MSLCTYIHFIKYIYLPCIACSGSEIRGGGSLALLWSKVEELGGKRTQITCIANLLHTFIIADKRNDTNVTKMVIRYMLPVFFPAD